MDFFLVLPTDLFEGQIRPALSHSYRGRSFEPCRILCQTLVPAVRAYQERYFSGSTESMLEQVARGRSFDRSWWKQLVGEVLLYAAVEVPEFQLASDTWCCLLAAELYHRNQAGIDPSDSQAFLGSRERFAPIQQALWGTQDLTFGSAVYRPDQAGLNLGPDVRRLADYLEGIEPSQWQESSLEGLRGCEPDDWAEELAYARDWFPELRALYRRVADGEQVVVQEQIF